VERRPVDKDVERKSAAATSGALREFTREQFEKFEKELKVRFDGFSINSKTGDDGRNTNQIFGDFVDPLKGSLQRLMFDFEWDRPDITSPIKSSLRSFGKRLPSAGMIDISAAGVTRDNYVFVFAECPHCTPCETATDHGSLRDSSLIYRILPPNVCREFKDVLGLKLYLIDMSNKVRINFE